MAYNALSLWMILSSIISAFLSCLAWRRRESPVTLSLSILLASVAVWSFFYGLELASTDLNTMMWMAVFEYVGIATVPILWMLFVARYTGGDRWLNPLNIGLLLIIPACSVVLVATNDIHHLFYSVTVVERSSGYRFLGYGAGPFWYVHIVYSYLAVIIGLLLILRLLLQVSPMNRFRAGCFLAGALLPFAVNIAYVFGFKPYGFLDITPIAFILMGIILASGVFGFQLFDIVPLALYLLFDSIPDAVLVLDRNERVLDTNRRARALLGSDAFRDRVARFRNENDGLPGDPFPVDPEQREVEIEGNHYCRTTTSIVSRRGRCLGSLVTMRDITERKKKEAALQEMISKLQRAIEEVKTLKGIVRSAATVRRSATTKDIGSGSKPMSLGIPKHSFPTAFALNACRNTIPSIAGTKWPTRQPDDAWTVRPRRR